MNFIISQGRSLLTLQLNQEEKAEILHTQTPEERSELIQEWLEKLICNSELNWILPEDTGDLTSAPLLGIIGSEETREQKGPHGAMQGGADEKGPFFYPILERWGYMSYQVTDPWEELAKEGAVIFWNGDVERPTPPENLAAAASEGGGFPVSPENAPLLKSTKKEATKKARAVSKKIRTKKS